MQQLTAYGWNEHFAASLEPGESIEAVGRVVQEHKEAYLVHAAGARLGNIWAEISGKMRHEGTVRSDFPAVGDWVMLRGLEHVPADRNPEDVGEHGPVQICRIFPRRTVLSRRLEAGDDQVLAVNVDIAFLGASLNENFNLRRLERYLTLSQNARRQTRRAADQGGPVQGCRSADRPGRRPGCGYREHSCDQRHLRTGHGRCAEVSAPGHYGRHPGFLRHRQEYTGELSWPRPIFRT